MVIAQIDHENDCSFAIKFADEKAKEKVIEFMEKGLDAWYEAAHDNIEDDEYFTADEKESFYWVGYAEPTLELMKRNGIEGDCTDIEYDDNRNVVNADMVISY